MYTGTTLIRQETGLKVWIVVGLEKLFSIPWLTAFTYILVKIPWKSEWKLSLAGTELMPEVIMGESSKILNFQTCSMLTEYS